MSGVGMPPSIGGDVQFVCYHHEKCQWVFHTDTTAFRQSVGRIRYLGRNFSWAASLHLCNMADRGANLQQLHCYHPFSDSRDAFLSNNHRENYSPKVVPTNPTGSCTKGWNVRHGLCHIYMRYVYKYELFIAFVCLLFVHYCNVMVCVVYCMGKWHSRGSTGMFGNLMAIYYIMLQFIKNTPGLLCSWKPACSKKHPHPMRLKMCIFVVIQIFWSLRKYIYSPTKEFVHGKKNSGETDSLF